MVELKEKERADGVSNTFVLRARAVVVFAGERSCLLGDLFASGVYVYASYRDFSSAAFAVRFAWFEFVREREERLYYIIISYCESRELYYYN